MSKSRSLLDAEIDRLSSAYEAAWGEGEPPELQAALATGAGTLGTSADRLAVELVVIDLRARWRYRTPLEGMTELPTADDYARLLLGDTIQPPSEWVIEELRARKRAGEINAANELQDRYRCQPQLLAVVSRFDAPTVATSPLPQPEKGLHVRCPYCRNPIELVPDAELESVACPSCGSDFSLVSDGDETRHANTVTQVAQFRLVERVGMGAFGAVWKAHDVTLDRTVAIKIPRKGQFDETQKKAFLREAQNAAQLTHPGIVPVYEVGRDRDTLFIVSEYVRGLTLADWLTGHQCTSREAAEVCAKIADALHHAHERGVVHRDLKPGNVMLDDQGEPRLMDFGLAKREAVEITMTQDGEILGTPAYMSPEQARGDAHAADRRSDVYSLGVILFQLCTGELPFRGNARMLLYQVLNETPPALRKLNSAVPRDLETIALRCLEKDPRRRYRDALSVSDEIRRWLRGDPIQARPITHLERSYRWARRNPWPVAFAAAVVLSLASVAAIAIKSAANERRDAEIARAAENEAARDREQAQIARLRAEESSKLARASAQRAEESSRRADNIVKLMTVFFEQFAGTGIEGRGPVRLSFEELLSRTEGRLETLMKEEPSMRASYHSTMSRVYGAKGETDKQIFHANEAFKLATESLGSDHPTWVAAQSDLANALLVGGAAATGSSELRLVVDQLERTAPDDPNLTQLLYYLARMEANVGKTAAAREAIKRADQRVASEELSPYMREVRWTAIAETKWRSGDYAGAIESYKSWLNELDTTPDSNVRRRYIRRELQTALSRAITQFQRSQRTEEAIELARELVAMSKQSRFRPAIFQDDGPEDGRSWSTLSWNRLLAKHRSWKQNYSSQNCLSKQGGRSKPPS